MATLYGEIFLAAAHQPIAVDYWGKEVDFNWFINPNDLVKVQQLKVDLNSEAGDPLFVDPKTGDFSVSIESPVFAMGWKNFPMDKFGVQKPALKAIAETPEIPEMLHAEIELNNTVNFYGGRIKNLTSDGEVSATGMHKKLGVLVIVAPAEGIFKTLKLLRNDVILKVNGVPVNDITELSKIVANQKIETILIWRNQSEKLIQNRK